MAHRHRNSNLWLWIQNRFASASRWCRQKPDWQLDGGFPHPAEFPRL